MNDRVQEFALAGTLIVLLFLAYNPFHFWMPPSVVMTMAAAFVVVFGAFAAFVWKEKSHDEREYMHRLMSARLGFISGMAVLLCAIIVQTINHDVDFWLPLTFAVMILTKIFGHTYNKNHH